MIGNLSINESCDQGRGEDHNELVESDMNDLRSDIALLKNMEGFEELDGTLLDSLFETEEKETILSKC